MLSKRSTKMLPVTSGRYMAALQKAKEELDGAVQKSGTMTRNLYKAVLAAIPQQNFADAYEKARLLYCMHFRVHAFKSIITHLNTLTHLKYSFKLDDLNESERMAIATIKLAARWLPKDKLHCIYVAKTFLQNHLKKQAIDQLFETCLDMTVVNCMERIYYVNLRLCHEYVCNIARSHHLRFEFQPPPWPMAPTQRMPYLDVRPMQGGRLAALTGSVKRAISFRKDKNRRKSNASDAGSSSSAGGDGRGRDGGNDDDGGGGGGNSSQCSSTLIKPSENSDEHEGNYDSTGECAVASNVDTSDLLLGAGDPVYEEVHTAGSISDMGACQGSGQGSGYGSIARSGSFAGRSTSRSNSNDTDVHIYMQLPEPPIFLPTGGIDVAVLPRPPVSPSLRLRSNVYSTISEEYKLYDEPLTIATAAPTATGPLPGSMAAAKLTAQKKNGTMAAALAAAAEAKSAPTIYEIPDDVAARQGSVSGNSFEDPYAIMAGDVVGGGGEEEEEEDEENITDDALFCCDGDDCLAPGALLNATLGLGDNGHYMDVAPSNEPAAADTGHNTQVRDADVQPAAAADLYIQVRDTDTQPAFATD